MNSNPRYGVAMVLLAACLWGTTGTAQSFGSGELSPLWFGALRLAVASLFFAACASLLPRPGQWPAGRPSASMVAALALAGVCMALYNLAFFAGIQLTGVAVGTTVALGSGPVWAGLLQGLLARRAPSAHWWKATLVAVTGGALMAMTSSDDSTPVNLGGIALCLLAGLGYAGYALVNKRLVGTAPSTSITLWAFTVAAVAAVPAAWFVGGAPRLHGVDVLALLYVGVLTSGVAYLLFSYALRHVSAATAVTLALGEPVVAFGLAVIVLGEQPGALAVIGLALVVAGVLGVARSELREARSSLPAPSAHPATVVGTASSHRPDR